MSVDDVAVDILFSVFGCVFVPCGVLSFYFYLLQANRRGAPPLVRGVYTCVCV